MPHPKFLTTKNILPFGFKVIHIYSANGNILWKNSVPNLPFSFRYIVMLSLPENEENVKYLMNSMINEETEIIEDNGINLSKVMLILRLFALYFTLKWPRS